MSVELGGLAFWSERWGKGVERERERDGQRSDEVDDRRDVCQVKERTKERKVSSL